MLPSDRVRFEGGDVCPVGISQELTVGAKAMLLYDVVVKVEIVVEEVVTVEINAEGVEDAMGSAVIELVLSGIDVIVVDGKVSGALLCAVMRGEACKDSWVEVLESCACKLITLRASDGDARASLSSNSNFLFVLVFIVIVAVQLERRIWGRGREEGKGWSISY